MAFRTLFFILFASVAVRAAENVTISKCCPFGEGLTNENKCVQESDPSWTVKVYSPQKRGFLAKNTFPPNWNLEAAKKPPCQRPALLSLSQTKPYIPLENGSLYVVAYNTVVPPSQYCLDYRSVLACLEDEAAEAVALVWVNKCCTTAGIFSETNRSCVGIRDPSYEIKLGDGMRLGGGFPNCGARGVAVEGKLHEADMLPNGSLLLGKDRKTLLPVANYCLDHILEKTGKSPSIIICEDTPTVVVERSKSHDLRFTIFPIGLALSAIFLAATLAAGALLPASHHVLHWRCQTNHVACLFGGDVLLCIVHLSNHLTGTPCFLIAVSMHFLFLAAFFWLNTMCFNIWWTFRDLRPQNVEKSQERCRLRLYEAYAWGIPFIFACTAAILEKAADQKSELLTPNFGNTCWFNGDMEILAFFYGPVGILLVVNLALFAMTARELTCGLWKRELVKSTSEKAALGRICLKLVVVMGVTWIADIISWAVGGPQEVWYLTDIINCLQGVFIFIVIGCQPQVLTAVKRILCFRKHREMGTAGTTNHHSSSSQGLPSMGDSVTNNSVTNNTTKSVPLETSC